MNEPVVISAPQEEAIHWLPPGNLTLRPQVRTAIDQVALAELAANIREHGIMQPVLGFLDGSETVVIDGEGTLPAWSEADRLCYPVGMAKNISVEARHLCEHPRFDPRAGRAVESGDDLEMAANVLRYIDGVVHDKELQVSTVRLTWGWMEVSPVEKGPALRMVCVCEPPRDLTLYLTPIYDPDEDVDQSVIKVAVVQG